MDGISYAKRVEEELCILSDKLKIIYNKYVFGNTEYAEDDVAVEACMNALTEAIDAVDELISSVTLEGWETANAKVSKECSRCTHFVGCERSLGGKICDEYEEGADS